MSDAWEDLPVINQPKASWEDLPLVAPSKGAAPLTNPDPSVWQSMVKGAQNIPTLGFGDEIGGAMQSALSGFEPGVYTQARDENRAEDKAARDTHPAAYVGAGLPLAIASSGGPRLLARVLGSGAARGLGALGRLGVGLGIGTAAGAGNSEADTAAGVVKDALGVDAARQAIDDMRHGRVLRGALGLSGAGTIGGGLTAGALEAFGAGGRALAPGMANSLEKTAIGQGRRALTNGADSLSKRNPISEGAVTEAIRSEGIQPFGTSAGAHARLQELTASEGGKYADLVSQFEARGLKGPDAQALANELLTKATDLDKNTMNAALPDLYRDAASQVQAKAGPSGSLGLSQAENLKRSLQQQAKYGRFEETPLNEVRRDMASVFRKANEDAIQNQAQGMGALGFGGNVQDLADQFVPTKQRLGRLMEAEQAAERGTARGAQRATFGAKEMAAAAGAGASGHGLLALPLAVATKVAKERLPSTIASYGLSAADALRGQSGPALGAGAYRLQSVIEALRKPAERRSRQSTPLDPYLEVANASQ